ncbi:hypothetical protein ACN6K6_001114 [Streptomyces violaceoruber]|uniref:hypothetical protein n=1 Tax=Streptomyces violaceoruber group TaxID=2867121 RepID=UPI00224304F6|nr:hypothetical protein [Streptomyces anthocyanicus]MCW8122477.1 hypothetical protein [Streptomyces anthocyanicus]
MLRLLRIRQRIMASGAFEVWAAAETIGGGELPPHPKAMRQEAAQLRSSVKDLEVVQRHCGQYFAVPGELSPVDRVALLMARLLIQGHCVISPSCPGPASP